ncbi:CDP-alcohol phosphatidyltransferase family protein, partial [bacterium]|nr:CDP-alcohol phosphatidyltransferase family protein [bacterium]
PVTYLAARLGLTPNHLTSASALLTLSALLIISAGSPHGLAGAGMAYGLLSFAYVLDSSDGQLARVAHSGSRFGAVFDHLVDGAKIVGLNLCLGWVLVDRADVRLGYLAMALNTFAQAMYFFGWNLKTASYGANLSRREGRPQAARRLLFAPLELMDWGLFIGCVWLLPWPNLLLPFYFVYGCGCMLTVLAYLAYSIAQMRRADAAERAHESSA